VEPSWAAQYTTENAWDGRKLALPFFLSQWIATRIPRHFSPLLFFCFMSAFNATVTPNHLRHCTLKVNTNGYIPVLRGAIVLSPFCL
jgi:hypothetical protein